jgi:hypothetical protein
MGAVIGADADDDPIVNGHIGFHNLSRQDVDHSAVFQDQIGGDFPSGGLYPPFQHFNNVIVIHDGAVHRKTLSPEYPFEFRACPQTALPATLFTDKLLVYECVIELFLSQGIKQP